MQQPASAGFTETVNRPDRKSRLLQVACEHFLQHGYNGTSLDAIVAESGGSKSTVYRHFKNKEGLFAEVVTYLCAEFLAKLESIDVTSTSLENGLRALLMELVNVITSPRHVAFYRLVITGSAQFPEVGRAWYDNGPLVSQGTIIHLLAELQARKKIPDTINKPVIAAILFDALLSNLTTQVVVLGKTSDAIEISDMIESLIALVTVYVGNEPPQ